MAAVEIAVLFRLKRGRRQPLLHLIVAYHAGLLRHQATAGENGKVRDAANIEASRERRVFLGVHFQHHGFAGHLRGSTSHFRSSHAARSAPVRPKIDEHRNGDIVDDFVEYFVDRQRLGQGRQRGFTPSATAGAGQIFCWNTVILAAMAAGTDYRQETPPSHESIPIIGCSESFRSLQQQSPGKGVESARHIAATPRQIKV